MAAHVLATYYVSVCLGADLVLTPDNGKLHRQVLNGQALVIGEREDAVDLADERIVMEVLRCGQDKAPLFAGGSTSYLSGISA